ncbi:MAG: glycosyltransferase family 2 protein [Chitinophagaceae bacterium]
MEYDITASIVLYKNKQLIKETIHSFLSCSSLKLKLYLIDNSPSDKLKTELKDILKNERISYIFNNKNIGFGAAHNIAIKYAIHQSTFHLVLNPDIQFAQGVLEELYHFMIKNKTVGQLLPQVLYTDGSVQKLCKLLPTPFNLIGRRFFPNTTWSKKLNNNYELQSFKYDHCINLPNLSGCFMFLRTEVLKKTGGFDTRYFMYLEDVDLTRRIHKIADTLFYPYVSIYHGYEKASYANPTILKHHITSAIKYFNKWGWFFDRERDELNKKLMQKLNASFLEQ